MSTTSRIRRFLELVVVVSILGGCNRSEFALAPVHGTVSIDDKPLAHGTIMFAPIAESDQHNPGKPAFGTLASEGEYNLTTFSNHDGAVIGDHWVTVLNVKEFPKGVPEFDRITFPKKVKVTAGHDNEINIKLTSDIIKKYGGDNR